jgi:hypothetical protein
MRTRREGAHRFFSDIVEGVRSSINHLALNLVCPASIISEAADASSNIAHGHGDGLAIIQRLNGSQCLGLPLKEIRELVQVLATIAWRNRAPFSFKCGASGLDGNVDILFGGFVNMGDDRLVRRIDDLESLAVNSFYKLIVNEAEAGSV